MHFMRPAPGAQSERVYAAHFFNSMQTIKVQSKVSTLFDEKANIQGCELFLNKRVLYL